MLKLIYVKIFLCSFSLLPLWVIASNVPFTSEKKQHNVSIVINQSVLNEMAKVNSEPCQQPDDFHLYADKKHLLSLNVFCRALISANYPFKLTIIASPNVKRGKALLSEGKAHALIHLVPQKDNLQNGEHLIYSDVVINDKERLSAFFTTLNNKKALAATSFEDLQNLKAAVATTWPWQQRWLDTLGISYQKLLYKNLFKFIQVKRADIVLLDMKGETPTTREMLGVELVAVGQTYFVGDKIEHFVLSSNIEGSQQLVTALSLGLSKLKADGVIDKLFAGTKLNKIPLKGWKSIPHPPRIQ